MGARGQAWSALRPHGPLHQCFEDLACRCDQWVEQSAIGAKHLICFGGWPLMLIPWIYNDRYLNSNDGHGSCLGLSKSFQLYGKLITCLHDSLYRSLFWKPLDCNEWSWGVGYVDNAIPHRPWSCLDDLIHVLDLVIYLQKTYMQVIYELCVIETCI